MWCIEVPIRVPVSKSKDFLLNLNVYRNAHHHTLNTAKVAFTNIVAPKVKHLPTMRKIRMSFILYAGSARSLDVSNVCCIVDKFFSDVLVKEKRIEDDNKSIVTMVAYGFGGIDRGNPRVEVIIEELD